MYDKLLNQIATESLTMLIRLTKIQTIPSQ